MIERPAGGAGIRPRPRRAAWAPVLAAALAGIAGGCVGGALPPDTGVPQATDVVTVVGLGGCGGIASRQPLPAGSYSSVPPGRPRLDLVCTPFVRVPLSGSPWILRNARRAPIETLVVAFRDSVELPRFPRPVRPKEWDHALNDSARARARTLADSLAGVRALAYAADSAEIGIRCSARVLDRFWILQAMVVEIRETQVDSLLAMPRVMSVQRARDGAPPPTGTTMGDARSVLGADFWRLMGLPGPWLMLLDTGVLTTHDLLQPPATLELTGDCVNGGSDCLGSTAPHKDIAIHGHGTASASILVGRDAARPEWNGFTRYPLASLNVYVPSATNPDGCALDVPAAIRGLEAALLGLQRVIVAEAASKEEHRSPLSLAADHACVAGAVVVAANGNHSDGIEHVAAPANARQVLGIGARSLNDLTESDGDQADGPTDDCRVKPDVQSASSIQAAGNDSDSSPHNLHATSGATASGGGAVALLYAWLARHTPNLDPGQVYAQAILFGAFEKAVDNDQGAGILRMPDDGVAAYGKIVLTGARNACEIPLSLPVGAFRPTADVEVALWWPERYDRFPWAPGVHHNDVDVAVIAPSGAVLASSRLAGSVFERARGTVPVVRVWSLLGEARFRLAITANTLDYPPQPVYWAAYVPPAVVGAAAAPKR